MRMMVLILVLFLSFSSSGATPESSKSQLRKLARLPKITIETGFTFDPRKGFALLSDRHDPRAELATLLRQLAQNPNDPEGHFKLGSLQLETGQLAQAKQTFVRAAELYRAKLESQPANAVLMSEYGQALAAAEQPARAESLFREALRTNPHAWKCWIGFGRFLDAKAAQRFSPIPGSSSRLSPEQIQAGVRRPNLTPEQLDQAEAALVEADQCFDRAVDEDGREPEVFLQRAMHRAFRGFLAALLAQARGNEISSEPMKAMFSPEALADLKQAVSLNPNEPRLLATAALYEAFFASLEPGRGNINEVSWTQLPEKNRQSLRQTMTQLENLGQNQNPTQAAAALEALGLLQATVVQDIAGAMANFRRAINLDPNREQSWDMSVVLLARPGTFTELLALCEERLEHKNSPRNLIMLAKAHERLDQFDEAEDSTAAALTLAPDDFTANLAQAALFLKRGDPASISQAERHLSKADRVQNKSRDQVIELALTLAVYFGLQENFDQARRLVTQVLQGDPDNAYAKDILTALR